MINLHKVPQDLKMINLSADISVDDTEQKETTTLKQYFLAYVNVGLVL